MNEWNILDLYFKNHKYPFTSHHLDSYRDFIKNNIPNIIKSYNPITMIKYNDSGEIIIKIEIYVGNKNSDEIFIDRPITFDGPSPKIITPNDARLRNLTYETHIYANVLVKITDNDKYNFDSYQIEAEKRKRKHETEYNQNKSNEIRRSIIWTD